MSTESRLTPENGGRRMLFIAYHFPPSAAIGGQRVVNFARGLEAANWSPYVLTLRDEDVEHLDRGRVDQIAGLPVAKVRQLPTTFDAVSACVKSLRGRGSRPGQPAAGAARQSEGRPGAEGISRKLRRYLLSMLALPDFQRGWLLPAALRAIQTVRRERIGWIMTSCPPYSVHLIGLMVKLFTGARWVADFRDPWMTTGSKRLYPTSALSKKIEGWLERQVMVRADVVTFNVDRLRRAYQGRYADVPPEKFVFIPNGIAAPTETRTPPARKYDAFTLSYTGALYVGRSAEPVFQAIAQLIENGSIKREAIRVKLVGHCREMNGVPTATIVSRYGLDSNVEVLDPVPQREAQDIIRQSHLALLLAPNLPYQIPAKVYDYLGAGTRILAIAEEGGTADLVRDTDFGKAFPSDDVEGMAQFIYQEFTAQATAPDHAAVLARFDVKRLTADLLAHLDYIDAGRQAQLAVTR
jgi:glycosyltransferase involved in cell wall biosynthesis